MPVNFSIASMEKVKAGELDEVKSLLARTRVRPGRKRTLHYPEKVSLIAEVKRSSPSRGAIRDVDAVTQAHLYRAGGAVAVSVLTDAAHFGGSYDDLKSVAESVDLPVLCKEFVFFNEQVELAARCGADIVLLIARALSARKLADLYSFSLLRGVTPLVEVHARCELDAVLALNPERVLVNTRNLETLEIERTEAFATAKDIPAPVEIVLASGMRTPEDVRRAAGETGVKLFLVGSALMDSGDPKGFIREATDVC